MAQTRRRITFPSAVPANIPCCGSRAKSVAVIIVNDKGTVRYLGRTGNSAAQPHPGEPRRSAWLAAMPPGAKGGRGCCMHHRGLQQAAISLAAGDIVCFF